MVKQGMHKDGKPFLGNDRYEGMISVDFVIIFLFY